MNTLRGFFELELPLGKVDCLLNLNALRIASEDMNCELNELLKGSDENPLKVIPVIYYAGHKNALFLKNEKAQIEFEQFAAQLGTLDFEKLTDQLMMATGAKDETLGNGEGVQTPTP